MNLTESLREALPPLPEGRARARMPRLHPDLISRQNIEDGEPVIAAMVRGSEKILRFTPDQWRLIELFDGVRSYDEIATLYAARYGVLYEVADLREFVAKLEHTGVWYNQFADTHAGHQHRMPAKKSKWADISHITFSAWDPDRYFDRLHRRMRWVYTRWFTALALLCVVAVFCLWIADWQRLAADNLAFFNFRAKSTSDLAEFWVLLLIIGFIHESAHGLTCKHYGAEVHSMGFHLIFLTPAFFVDVSEAWIYAARWQRLIIILAGLWAELILAAAATLLWWGTPSGSYVHDVAYKMILLNGVLVIGINLNPLVKLDGYYAVSELVGYADLKERATAYLSGLVRGRLFRLPVMQEYVPVRRRPLYLSYAVFSGIYSYGLLISFVFVCYHAFSRIMPIWAFLPTLVLAFMIFRSRIRLFFTFCRTVYLDKRDALISRIRLGRVVAGTAMMLALLLVPFWHETVMARVLLEPLRTETVRAVAPGYVQQVFISEGQSLRQGDALASLTNLRLQGEHDTAEEAFQSTALERANSLLAHRSLGLVQQRHLQAATERTIANEESATLTPRAPFSSVVVTPRVRDLAGTYLSGGSAIAEVADLKEMRVRMYILDYAVGRVEAGDRADLLLDGTFAGTSTRILELEMNPELLPGSLVALSSVESGVPLRYFVANATIPNDGELRIGMTGTAKIFVARRSLAVLFWREMKDFIYRKIW